MSEETTAATTEASTGTEPEAPAAENEAERTAPETEPATAPEPASEIAPDTDSATASETPAEPVPLTVPRRLVFRFPASAYVVIAFLGLCVSFVAVASAYATLVYLLPLGALVWVMRTRTEVDADRLVIRTVLFRTVLPWSKVASFRVAERGWIRAVRTDGGEIALPTVRTRHLPALALISGGRLSDPTADPDQS